MSKIKAYPQVKRRWSKQDYRHCVFDAFFNAWKKDEETYAKMSNDGFMWRRSSYTTWMSATDIARKIGKRRVYPVLLEVLDEMCEEKTIECIVSEQVVAGNRIVCYALNAPGMVTLDMFGKSE